MGISQQAASQHLRELEDEGLITRNAEGKGISVMVTDKGRHELLRVYNILHDSLHSRPDHVEITGTLVSGMNEGAYYMSREGYTGQFQERLGYVPFPGTLNVDTDRKHGPEIARLDGMNGTIIDGFTDGKRSYGWVKCFAGTLNGTIPCHLIRLERTHHGSSTVELISKLDIRKETGLDDGGKITIRIPLEQED
ncbi:transcriptional regulator of a riboflavin/FAD biosynthetic operon [Cenarchaeum symbiosum A]|uniref:Riboflavin kinase n=1 Tax=Cenarchaeum symbiosum (strain A) TaxID=414004 RepID=RIFK_CENSY|nr:RecName: Full=Riboflavin kinase; Short=RFK; AltName: Full=CTP-dependent riboflavin kinase; AltName: Full=CTP:riboflavin 5'-phosphotransferase; AltName: Full=Flavokinase [Cenarchaeum symbiosum A]ABK76773.1 transcriptional regulator of a riboflavin/FAD biosynthetic operon [Cenarchaeum symbiosum A]